MAMGHRKSAGNRTDKIEHTNISGKMLYDARRALVLSQDTVCFESGFRAKQLRDIESGKVLLKDSHIDVLCRLYRLKRIDIVRALVWDYMAVLQIRMEDL